MKNLMNVFDDNGWEAAGNYPKGTLKKVLRDENGAITMLIKFPENFKMEPHSHITAEQHFVLEGSYTSKGKEYPAGSYQLIAAHEDHGPFESENGALILVIWDPYKFNK
ncbi:MAG: cupin domain-containing protein [Draconibacterium sp.]|nr:cupin domain-containing protein [Draconibacterium sp.]